MKLLQFFCVRFIISVFSVACHLLKNPCYKFLSAEVAMFNSLYVRCTEINTNGIVLLSCQLSIENFFWKAAEPGCDI